MLLPSCQLALIVVDVVTPGVRNLKARLAGMYFSKVMFPTIGSVEHEATVPIVASSVAVDFNIRLPLA